MHGLIAVICIGTWVLAGCASLNIDPLDYAEAPMERAAHLPSAQALKGEAIRVAISAFELTGSGASARLAHHAGLPALMATAVEGHIDDTGARIVDRGEADALMDEVVRIEEIGRAHV